MSGKYCRKCLLLLVLVLCSPFLFSQPLGDVVPEFDPWGIYEVLGWRLIELQNERTLRETTISELETTLKRQLTNCDKAITDLETSSLTSLERARSAESRAMRYRSISIVLGTTTAGGVLFILATIFGR